MILLLAALASAEPFAGVVLRPFSRADLVWVTEDRTSGEGVGEFDGVVRPGLQPFVGAWVSDRVGVLGALGVAHHSTSTYVGDTGSRRTHTVVRPSVDLRVALRTQEPRVWGAAGIYADIPAASDRSDAYTPEEQQAANDSAGTTRARLGGGGGSIGAGVEVHLLPTVSVGFQYRLEMHRGTLRDTASVTTSTWLASDAGLLATLHWPRRAAPADTEASR